jgi:hypothetical protein
VKCDENVTGFFVSVSVSWYVFDDKEEEEEEEEEG